MVSQFLSVTTLHINYGVGGVIDISAELGEAGSRDLGGRRDEVGTGGPRRDN